MPTWGELLRELSTEAESTGQLRLDELRRSALTRLHALTGRPTIVYASRWLSADARPDQTAVALADVHAFMEVLHGLRGPRLDLILHSSGGSPTAAEAVVSYIRTKFDHVRVFVPLAAMSAATMIACAADEIVLGKHSYLGPTDPQLVLQTPLGIQAVPAYAIVKQFEMAQADAKDPTSYAAWLPMLQQYGPALLVQCRNALELSEELVREWLEKWMFRDDADRHARAKSVALALNDHDKHHVHGRFLARARLRDFGLKILDLEDDQDLQDRVLTVFHALMHTFSLNAQVTKIVENDGGKAFITGRPVMQAPPIHPLMQAFGPAVPPAPPRAPPRRSKKASRKASRTR